MLDKINEIRNRKYDSEFDKAVYYNLKVIAIVFMLLAIGGWLVVFYIMMSNVTVESIPKAYLFLTSSGCFAMCIAYLVMRSKMRKLDKYQENIIDCVYDSLEMFHNHMYKHDRLLKSIEDKLENEMKCNIKLRSEEQRSKGLCCIAEGNRGEIELRHISLNNCVFIDNNHFNEIILLELSGISTLPNEHNVNKIISIISI